MSEEYYNGEEKKQVSFENWLKDERLDKQAGITPTHPGHSVDSPSRWSGQGKGDVDKPVSEKFLARYDEVFGSYEKDDSVIRIKYRPEGKLYITSTADGIKELTEEEYNKQKSK